MNPTLLCDRPPPLSASSLNCFLPAGGFSHGDKGNGMKVVAVVGGGLAEEQKSLDLFVAPQSTPSLRGSPLPSAEDAR